MNICQAPYRTLVDELDAPDVLTTLARWLAENEAEAAWLGDLRLRGQQQVPEVSVEELMRLYALSRVSDTLIHGVASGAIHDGDYRIFMMCLGLEPTPDTPFHPFFHEIVTVTEAPESDAEITIIDPNWRGVMCGSLLIARSGVSISAGANQIRKAIAENSTLYWAYRRDNRPTEDLSMG